MDVQVDRFGKVEAEDSHDGFCVDNVSSGNKIEVIVDEIEFMTSRNDGAPRAAAPMAAPMAQAPMAAAPMAAPVVDASVYDDDIPF